MVEEINLKDESLDDGSMDHEYQPTEQSQEDRFTDFMFGPRRRQQPLRPEEQQVNHNPSYIDYEQLMISFDLLMESIQNLKPLFQKFKPFVEQIWKKK